MSYIQIEVDGVKRGLKFNQMALVVSAQFTDEENQLGTAGYALFYAGLKANCYVKREELDLNFEQCCDLFDKLNNEQVQAITKAFQESIAFQDKLPKEEIKKKKVKKTTLTDA